MPEVDMPTVDATETLSIIPATKKEMAHVIMLAHRIWPDAYRDILTSEQIENMLLRIYNYESLQKETDAGHQFHVAYMGHMPVGYASAYLEGDVIWLKKLYVDRDYKGKRIGVRLMHTAVSALLPATEIRLLVNPDNKPAQNFYTHMGFSKIAEVPVQMGDWHFNDHLFSMSLTNE